MVQSKKKSEELTLLQYSELLFGAKAEELTDKQKREYVLAVKNGALIYRRLPMQGDKVGIKILEYV